MGMHTTEMNAPQSPAERAGSVGHEAKDATQDVAATAAHEAQRVTREAKDQVRQLWGQTRADLTDQAATQQARAASGLRELADQLGQMARSADGDGAAVGLVDDVARRAGDAASWLDARDPGSLLDEARSFARRRPGTFLALAAGIGVVAGRLSRGLVDEARDDSTGAGSMSADQGAGTAGPPATARTTGATGSAGATGVGGDGMPSATSPTTATPSRSPSSGASADTVATGGATVPGDGLPGAHRTTQPMMPDGTPTPISREGVLGAPADDRAGVPRDER